MWEKNRRHYFWSAPCIIIVRRKLFVTKFKNSNEVTFEPLCTICRAEVTSNFWQLISSFVVDAESHKSPKLTINYFRPKKGKKTDIIRYFWRFLKTSGHFQYFFYLATLHRMTAMKKESFSNPGNGTEQINTHFQAFPHALLLTSYRKWINFFTGIKKYWFFNLTTLYVISETIFSFFFHFHWDYPTRRWQFFEAIIDTF